MVCKLTEKIIQSVLVGIITMVVGSFVAKLFKPIELPEVCKSWNKFHIMEWSFFVTGVVMHLLPDATSFVY